MAGGIPDYDVVVVGTGHAGAQVAIALRQNCFEGSILMVGRDGLPPYERPPLSKEYLGREKPFERLLIRPETFWGVRSIALKLDACVASVDAGARTITTSVGETMTYGKLVWAAGGDPRQLPCPGAALCGVHYVRDKMDADRMMAQLDAGARQVVVIGGGYIGLEAAAVLTKLGCNVILLEAQDRVLARVAGRELASFFEAEHRAHGVEIRKSAQVERIAGVDGKATGVVLATGETIPAELVVVGIGIVPAVAPLIAAGASGVNGVEVDAYCRTSLQDIYAIGDCAAHHNEYANGAAIRLESVQNANDMAAAAAKTICGDPQPYRSVPWFWSNQYDLRLQTVGLSIDADATVLRGDPASRSFSVVHLRKHVVVALDCVNATRDYVQGRKLVENRARIDPATLADAGTPLKEMS